MTPDILSRVSGHNYAVFEGELNVNIIAVRSASRVANAFDDTVHLVYQAGGQWVEHRFAVTTDPGTYWLENPMRVEGTAILVPNQYRGAYKLGFHRGIYEALVQAEPVAVYRDNDRDSMLDPEPQEPSWGFFGINVHKAGAASTQVDKWSAGCIVFAEEREFALFLAIVKASMSLYGDAVTLTLIGD